MERGDIATWTSRRIIVVLEGVLTTPRYDEVGLLRKKRELVPADEWMWEDLPLRYVVDYSSRLNVAVEVVTFMGPEVAELAAEWFNRYGVNVAESVSVDFDQFCRSLLWRLNEVERVIDSEPSRLQHYGQLGYSAVKGSSF
jgi:hypothetical protein